MLWGMARNERRHRRNDPDRMTLCKYDPVVGRHVDFREER
ncbi:MAG: 50S ribosomal protein L33 [Streptomyces sp.]|nr:50S ribosomal protein L33 [Streptomyces sp.]NUS85978.1 50S ribosomal protein L33 [Streptomyces sp.]